MTASGTAGHGAELGRLRRPRRARRGRREVAVGRAVAGQPGAAGARDAGAGCSTPSGCRARASRRWLADDLPGAARAPAPRVVASIWGRTVDDYARGRRRCSPTRRPTSSPSRSTCRARTSRPATACSPTRPTATADGRWPRRPRAAGPRWAKLSPNVDRPRRDRRRGARRRRRGGHARQHRARHGDRPRDPPARASAPAAAACRARPSTRSRCAPCTTSTRPCPTCRSSASAASPTGGDAVELLLAGASAVQVGHGHLRRSRGRRPRCCTELERLVPTPRRDRRDRADRRRA